MEALRKFEEEAIRAICASDAERDVFLSQLASAACQSRDYTGSGVYTKLAVDPSGPRLNEARWKIEDMPSGHAQHPDVPAGIGFILWVEAGYISCLESYTFDGWWPADESLISTAT
jgi:hypothetical protein